MRQPETSDLSVSIIVPTFNRRERLHRLLSGLAHEHEAGARFEVIVSVDGSTDGTPEMLSGLEHPFPCRVLLHANSGPAAARNRAIGAAQGEILLFLDDDVVPAIGLVQQHVNVHREDPNAVVTGPMVAPADGLPAWLRWEALMLLKQYTAMVAGEWRPSARQFYTANASVRRHHVFNAGGFDEHLRRAEDVELAYRLARAGLRFHFLHTASVLHEPDRSFDSWLNVAYEYGRQDVVMTSSCGHSEVLPRVFREWPERNRLSRCLTRACVGRRVLVAAATRTVALFVRPAVAVPDRVKMLLCSALFNIHYWQGVADETGHGSGVWAPLQQELERPHTAKSLPQRA